LQAPFSAGLPGCSPQTSRARTGLPLGVEREVTRGLKPRPTGFIYEGVSMFFHEKIMFLNHSSGESFNVEATSVDD